VRTHDDIIQKSPETLQGFVVRRSPDSYRDELLTKFAKKKSPESLQGFVVRRRFELLTFGL
jgi:hypothetical protein